MRPAGTLTIGSHPSQAMNAPSPTIYTVGHGSDDFAGVFRRLAIHNVGMIADVRSVPYSRHAPQFTKDELTHLTAEFNVGYRWLGDRLGGRPSDPELLRDGQPDWAAIGAGAAFAAGLSELEGLTHSATVAIMCSELDPSHCHRSVLIAPVLEERGYRVMHVLADGTAARHQPPLPAL
jgi:uncharacterized protein (DUF488 family)